MNAGLKQQIPTIRRRCADYKPNGRRGASRVNIDHNSHEEVLCHRHKPQEKDSRKTVRHCDGTTKAGNACGVRVANTSIFTPTFCARHSAREPHYVFCFGVANAATNQRCKTRIRWQEPYFQFCQQHASQAQSFKQAVAVLPNDLVEEVTRYV